MLQRIRPTYPTPGSSKFRLRLRIDWGASTGGRSLPASRCGCRTFWTERAAAGDPVEGRRAWSGCVSSAACASFESTSESKNDICGLSKSREPTSSAGALNCKYLKQIKKFFVPSGLLESPTWEATSWVTWLNDRPATLDVTSTSICGVDVNVSDQWENGWREKPSWTRPIRRLTAPSKCVACKSPNSDNTIDKKTGRNVSESTLDMQMRKSSTTGSTSSSSCVLFCSMRLCLCVCLIFFCHHQRLQTAILLG